MSNFDIKNHWSFALLDLYEGLHRRPVNFPTKMHFWILTRDYDDIAWFLKVSVYSRFLPLTYICNAKQAYNSFTFRLGDRLMTL